MHSNKNIFLPLEDKEKSKREESSWMNLGREGGGRGGGGRRVGRNWRDEGRS